MSPWKNWKSGFDRWEKTTAEYFDKTLQNPGFLGPSAGLLKAMMQTKSNTDKAMNMWWNTLGLTNRDEQDRTLHRINQLESRILDLEEELLELKSASRE
jgi:hypothetical protein